MEVEKIEDEDLSVEGPVAEEAPTLEDRQAVQEKLLVMVGRKLVQAKALSPYGLLWESGRWVVVHAGVLRQVLPSLWSLPIFSQRYLDFIVVYTPGDEAPVLRIPKEVDEVVLVSVGVARVGRLLVKNVDGTTMHAVDGWMGLEAVEVAGGVGIHRGWPHMRDPCHDADRSQEAGGGSQGGPTSRTLPMAAGAGEEGGQ